MRALRDSATIGTMHRSFASYHDADRRALPRIPICFNGHPFSDPTSTWRRAAPVGPGWQRCQLAITPWQNILRAHSRGSASSARIVALKQQARSLSGNSGRGVEANLGLLVWGNRRGIVSLARAFQMNVIAHDVEAPRGWRRASDFSSFRLKSCGRKPTSFRCTQTSPPRPIIC